MDSRRDDGSVEPVDRVGSDDTRTAAVRDETTTQTETAHYHRKLMPVVLPWLVGLIGVPLILAGITALGAPAPVTPTTPAGSVAPASPGLPSPSTDASPGVSGPVFQINQDGTVVTIAGQVPDAATKKAVVDAVTQAYGKGVTVSAQQLTVNPSAPAPANTALTDLAAALKSVGGVTLDAQGGNVNVTGVAADENSKTALLNAVRAAFPGATVAADGLLVGDPAQPPASCDATGAYVAVVTTDTRIQFSVGSSTLTPRSLQALKRIADAAKKCTAVKLLVSGNTDNTGTEATNQRISEQRAATVKNQLVRYGVAAANITTQGVGSTKPIASNATDKGRSLNRRVDITVS